MTTKTMSNVDVKTLCVTLYIAQFFTLRTFIDNAHLVNSLKGGQILH